jgi:hypothetical protein
VAVGHGIERPSEQSNARHGGGLARARPRRKAGSELVIGEGGKNWRRAGTWAIHIGFQGSVGNGKIVTAINEDMARVGKNAS